MVKEQQSHAAVEPEAAAGTPARDSRPLLIVADLDVGLRLLLKQILSAAGYDVRPVESIQAVAAAVHADNPAGLLMSASLAGDQTPALLRSIRARSPAFVIALCADGQTGPPDDLVDDSLSAPFGHDDLVLRIAKAHRRARLRQNKALAFVREGLVIDLTLNDVSLNGRRVSLSRLEFEVLRILAENQGRIVGYDQLLRESWRRPNSSSLNKLRHVIHLLRLKLGQDDRGLSFIVTDSRAGYGLRRSDDERCNRP